MSVADIMVSVIVVDRVYRAVETMMAGRLRHSWGVLNDQACVTLHS